MPGGRAHENGSVASRVHRTYRGASGWAICGEYILCRCHSTHEDSKVTCKKCLREIGKDAQR